MDDELRAARREFAAGEIGLFAGGYGDVAPIAGGTAGLASGIEFSIYLPGVIACWIGINLQGSSAIFYQSGALLYSAAIKDQEEGLEAVRRWQQARLAVAV